MDFSFTPDQIALSELAAQIFSTEVSDDSRAKIAESGEDFDAHLWKVLANAGLLGASLPEEDGGSGLGVVEFALLLQQQGATLAPVPLLPAIVLGAWPIAVFADKAQRARLLPGLVAGSFHLSGELSARLSPAFRERPLSYVRSEQGYTLNGMSNFIPVARGAQAVLVAATSADGTTSMFLVSPDAAGVTVNVQKTTNHEAVYLLDFVVVAAEMLGAEGEGGEIALWVEQRAITAFAALQLGVVGEALKRTAAYTNERRQFGKPIASFQAVAHRAADGYIDIEWLRSVCWQAAWRLDNRLPAERAVSTAAWWTCRAGHRIGHTVQHLHGGVGADLAYPIHRFFLTAKNIEFTLGGPARHLATLGRHLLSLDTGAAFIK